MSPSSPYHHLVCGDWWDEQPGSPTYDTFQHLAYGSNPPYGDDSEALWTEIQPYQHFIDIMMPNPPDDGAGIFLDDERSSSTGMVLLCSSSGVESCRIGICRVGSCRVG